MRYAAYIRSPHWRQFRRSAEKRLPQVCPCGATTGLDLHHMTYEHLGQERLDDVAWLCRDCHRALHADDPSGGLFDPTRAESIQTDDSPARRSRDRAAVVRAIELERRKAKDDPERKVAIENFSQRFGLRY